MKGLKSTIALAVALIGLGAYIYFVTGSSLTVRTPARKPTKYSTVSGDKIEEIKVTTASGDAVTARKSGTAWALTEPSAAPADEAEISAMTNALSTADVVRVVGRKPVEPERLRPVESAHRSLVQGRAATKTTDTCSSAKKRRPAAISLPSGTTRKKCSLLAAFQESSLNKSAFDLRDKNVLKVDRDKIDRVDLTAGTQTVEIAKDGGEWKLTKPAASARRLRNRRRIDRQAADGPYEVDRHSRCNTSGLEEIRLRQTTGDGESQQRQR
jgi:hypothetical protein